MLMQIGKSTFNPVDMEKFPHMTFLKESRRPTMSVQLFLKMLVSHLIGGSN